MDLIIKVELKMVSTPTFDRSKIYIYFIYFKLVFLVTVPNLSCTAVANMNFKMVHTVYMYSD